MGCKRLLKCFILLFVFLGILSPSAPGAQAQPDFVLSKNADFSTDDRVFTRDDVLHMRVFAPNIDFTDLKKNEFRIKPDHQDDDNDFEGSFHNLLNGTYESAVNLSAADPRFSRWELHARIEDESGNRFETEVSLIIEGEGEAEATIRGAVDSVGVNFIVVNNALIQVDSETRIFDRDGSFIDLTDLGVGDVVHVLFRIMNEAFTAIEIRRDDFPNDEIEFKGLIEELGEESVVVLGVRFFVDAQTEILDNNNNIISFSELSVGQLVQIKGNVQVDGTVRALRIKIEDENFEIEFKGEITALSEASIEVNGIVFVVTNATEIVDNEGNLLDFSELAVGQFVEIRAEIDIGGLFVATRIQVRNDFFGDDEVEVIGIVTNVGKESISVAGFTFLVTGETDIFDDENRAIELSDIRVGFLVEVRANLLGDGRLLATKIKVEHFFGDVVELTGAIDDIGDEFIEVLDRIFIVTHATIILDNKGNAIDLEVLSEGDVVQVRGETIFDGTLIATHIKLEDNIEDIVELTGTIDEIGQESLVVAGIRFLVDANTSILDNEGNVIAFSDLSVGLIVEIRAELLPDGNLLATDIKIEDRIEDEVEITGVIEALSEDAIKVLGRSFGITDHTIFLDDDNNNIEIGSLFVGQTVEVRGDLLPDGTLIAIRIKIEDVTADQIEVTGPIESLGDGTIEVIGIHFFVDDSTEVLDKASNPIDFDELEIGQTVQVRALGQPNGTRIAFRIKIEDVLLLSAPIEEIVFNGFQMVGRNVLIDGNTLILAKQNQVITLNKLHVGQFVEVRALRNGGNTIFGTKVRVQDARFPTSVNPDPLDTPLAESFILLENYPNPFNPRTTITFKLPQSGNQFVQTRVRIFNLLGQSIKTLVNEPLATGLTHARVWDGSDDLGKQVSSGVYLYRLEAGSKTAIRRMTLIK